MSVLLDGRALLDADQLLAAGLGERRASFEVSFERLPPHVGFVVVCGVEAALDALRPPLADPARLEATVRVGACSERLAERLAARASFDVDAVPDGTLAFAGAPVASVEGPVVEVVVVAALLAAALGLGTSVATRAARLHLAGGGDSIVDATSAAASPDHALAIARAAHVGGASVTTCALAAAELGIPFCACPRLELSALGAREQTSGSSGTWGPFVDDLVELGPPEDEEAMLVENHRLGRRAAGWLARGLDITDQRAIRARAELVALENDGAWTPRRGSRSSTAVIPGRKMVARYLDAAGRAVADVVHLTSERMTPPKALGAATLTPLARPVIRAGHALDTPEAPAAGRARALAARATIPAEVVRLRSPARYPVRTSQGVEQLSR